MTDEEILLARFRGWLRNRARMLLGDYESRHVEDLAAEGWIAIWREVRSSGKTDPPWLQAVAHNRMRNWIRDELAAPQRGERNALYVEDVARVWEGDYALGEVELAYHRGEIARALDALTDQQREYVVLRFWHGLPAAELNDRFQTKNSSGIWKWAKLSLARELAHLSPLAP